jgi:hypothetical protein
VARELAIAGERAEALDQSRRVKLASYVVGNVIFALGHELGHAVITDVKLPVLGREEDAADSAGNSMSSPLDSMHESASS